VFVSSHLLDELEQICDHLVVIEQGRLVFAGDVTELLASHEPKLSVVPEDREHLADIVALCQQEGRPAIALDDRVVVSAPAAWAGELNRMTMRRGITLCQLGAVPVRLEDAFFHLTGPALPGRSVSDEVGAGDVSDQVVA